MLLALLGGGILLAVLLLIGVAWAIFYYPMALAVAGYTQSVGAVINSMIALDTIRRVGVTYFKAFGMVLSVRVVGVIVVVVMSVMRAPLALLCFVDRSRTL